MSELRLSCADVKDMIVVPRDLPMQDQVWNIPEVFRLRLKRLLSEAGFDLSRSYLAWHDYGTQEFVYQQEDAQG